MSSRRLRSSARGRGEGQDILGHRLDQVVVCAPPQAVHGGAGLVDGRDHDALSARAGVLDMVEQGHAIHFGAWSCR